MKRKIINTFLVLFLGICVLAGCGETTLEAEKSVEEIETTTAEILASTEEDRTTAAEEETVENGEEDSVENSAENQPPAEDRIRLEDGVYSAVFETDSSMFHVNETQNNRGILTVRNGQMMIHVTLAGKGILNLYPGLAEDAEKEGAAILEPTIDSVTYSDGLTEEAYGFDVPVPYINQEFDVALVGKKGKWYDHKVKVSEVIAQEQNGREEMEVLEDGDYQVSVTLKGGTGKATILSPTVLMVREGRYLVTLVWSSKNYDYMLVEDVKYENEAAEGDNSTFTIPVAALSEELPVIADTIAMSTPHEIAYTLYLELQ